MHDGTIICSLGIRYRSYCSNVIRTLIVNARPQQSTYYEYLHNLMDWTISHIKPGELPYFIFRHVRHLLMHHFGL